MGGVFTHRVGTFNPAGGASDPNFASVVLLTNFDGIDGGTTFVDDSNSAHALTAVGNAQTDTGITKFSKPTLLLDGAGDYVSTPDSAGWTLGSGDFTIEGWFYFASIGPLTSAQTLVNHWGASGSRGWQFLWNGGATPDLLQFYLSTTGSNTVVVLSTAWTPTTDSWHYLAVDRSGTAFRSYVDGAMLGSATDASTIFDAATTLFLGASTGGAQVMEGSVFDVRITKGVARYASDSGFTVPTAPHPRS